MIITRTPFRLSFFGGGADSPSFFRRHPAAVLSTSIDKYCYVMVRRLPPFFPYASELAYSTLERVGNVDEIRHPAIRNAMKFAGVGNIRLTYEADLPARSGLGTSSSFAVGMLHAFRVLNGQRVDKKSLADDAIYLERTLCAEAGGWQDQIAASFGGFNRIDFGPDGYAAHPVAVPPERLRRLNDNLLLFFTGFTRLSSEIHKASESAERPEEREARLLAMAPLVDEAERILTSPAADLDAFGRLLHETWTLKRRGYGVTTGAIDALYDAGIKAGASGGKLLGAGGGGFLTFYVPEGRQNAVRDALRGLILVPFRFETSGSTLLYHSPDTE